MTARVKAKSARTIATSEPSGWSRPFPSIGVAHDKVAAWTQMDTMESATLATGFHFILATP